jgi:hypothetical protein
VASQQGFSVILGKSHNRPLPPRQPAQLSLELTACPVPCTCRSLRLRHGGSQ